MSEIVVSASELRVLPLPDSKFVIAFDTFNPQARLSFRYYKKKTTQAMLLLPLSGVLNFAAFVQPLQRQKTILNNCYTLSKHSSRSKTQKEPHQPP